MPALWEGERRGGARGPVKRAGSALRVLKVGGKRSPRSSFRSPKKKSPCFRPKVEEKSPPPMTKIFSQSGPISKVLRKREAQLTGEDS